MKQRYKVLAAMLAFREFSATELSEYSGVNAQTVRSVLDQFRHCLSTVDIRRTGKPGGQDKVRRISDDGALYIKAQLTSAARQLQSTQGTVVAESKIMPNNQVVPAELVVAEDLVFARIPEAGDPGETARLIEEATHAFEVARRETAGVDPSSEIALRIEGLESALAVYRAGRQHEQLDAALKPIAEMLKSAQGLVALSATQPATCLLRVAETALASGDRWRFLGWESEPATGGRGLILLVLSTESRNFSWAQGAIRPQPLGDLRVVQLSEPLVGEALAAFQPLAVRRCFLAVDSSKDNVHELYHQVKHHLGNVPVMVLDDGTQPALFSEARSLGYNYIYGCGAMDREVLEQFMAASSQPAWNSSTVSIRPVAHSKL